MSKTSQQDGAQGHATVAANIKLPTDQPPTPELRLLIYDHTRALRIKKELRGRPEALKRSWSSTPLVNLAATCHLIANEARAHVHSLPPSQRVARVKLSASRDPYSPWYPLKIRLRQIPCPVADLRRVVVSYDFERFRTAEFGFPVTSYHENPGAMRNIEGHVFGALCRLMKDTALDDATNLELFRLHITGLRRNGGEEQVYAIRRILSHPRPEEASADQLAQGILSNGCAHENLEKRISTLRLAVIKGRPLYLLV